MIQIELNALDTKISDNQPISSTHVCVVSDGDRILGELFLFVDQNHGRLERTVVEDEGDEYLDGLVKTTIHQLFWKGIRSISFENADDDLREYFSQCDFAMEETGEETRFLIEDFIQATGCSHG